MEEAIAQLKSRIEPMTNAMHGLIEAWTALLDDVDRVAGDLQETKNVTAAYRAHTDQILSMALKDVKPLPIIE